MHKANLIRFIFCLILPGSFSFSLYSSQTLALPESGNWFNQQAGNRTGLNLEIQDGVLAGAYYGFDADGQQVWLLFSGALAINDDQNYEFTGELTRSSGGGCIVGCDASGTDPQHQIETVGTIDIEFTGRSSGRFRVDDNSFQDIAPLIYGTSSRAVFAEFPEVQIPDLSGIWAVETTFFGICGSTFSATMMEFGEPVYDMDNGRVEARVDESVVEPTLLLALGSAMQSQVTATGNTSAGAAIATAMGTDKNADDETRCTPPIDPFFSATQLLCEVQQGEQPEPVCRIQSTEQPAQTILQFNPVNASDNHISGVILRSSDGDQYFTDGRFTAMRLFYD